MKKLTEQILLKMSPELVKLIDAAFSAHLKTTGEYISKAEFIRQCIEKQCKTKEKKKASENA